jgi:hypothetical protein
LVNKILSDEIKKIINKKKTKKKASIMQTNSIKKMIKKIMKIIEIKSDK